MGHPLMGAPVGICCAWRTHLWRFPRCWTVSQRRVLRNGLEIKVSKFQGYKVSKPSEVGWNSGTPKPKACP